MQNYQNLLENLLRNINKKQPSTSTIITLNMTRMLHPLNQMKPPPSLFLVRELRDKLLQEPQLQPRNILKSIKLINLIKPNKNKPLSQSSHSSWMISRVARETLRWKGDVAYKPIGLLRSQPRQACSRLCRPTHQMLSAPHLEILTRELIIIIKENPKIKYLKRLHCWHLNLKVNASQHPIVFVRERTPSSLSARTTIPSSWLWKPWKHLMWKKTRVKAATSDLLVIVVGAISARSSLKHVRMQLLQSVQQSQRVYTQTRSHSCVKEGITPSRSPIPRSYIPYHAVIVERKNGKNGKKN